MTWEVTVRELSSCLQEDKERFLHDCKSTDYLWGSVCCSFLHWADSGPVHAGGRRKKNPVLIYLAGFFLTLAVFQIIAVPVILMKPWGFPIIVKLYSGALILLSAAGLFLGGMCWGI